MKESQETTNVDLLCTPCMMTTSHIITYVHGQLASIECEHCHRKVEVHEQELSHEGKGAAGFHRISLSGIHKIYTTEFAQRILTKPHRIGEQLQEDLSLFLMTLPLRLVTKPYRLTKEILRHDDSCE